MSLTAVSPLAPQPTTSSSSSSSSSDTDLLDQLIGYVHNPNQVLAGGNTLAKGGSNIMIPMIQNIKIREDGQYHVIPVVVSPSSTNQQRVEPLVVSTGNNEGDEKQQQQDQQQGVFQTTIGSSSTTTTEGSTLNNNASECDFELDTSSSLLKESSSSTVLLLPSSTSTSSLPTTSGGGLVSTHPHSLHHVNSHHQYFKSTPNLSSSSSGHSRNSISSSVSSGSISGGANHHQQQQQSKGKRYKSVSNSDFKLESSKVSHHNHHGVMVSSSLPPLAPLPTNQSTTFLTSPLSSSTIGLPTSMGSESILANSISQTYIPALASSSTTTSTTSTFVGSPPSGSEGFTSPINSPPFSSLSPILKAHSFKNKFFTQPTRCRLCEQYMWVVIGKQGLICLDCGSCYHKLCAQRIGHNCASFKNVAKSTTMVSLDHYLHKIHLDEYTDTVGAVGPTTSSSRKNSVSALNTSSSSISFNNNNTSSLTGGSNTPRECMSPPPISSPSPPPSREHSRGRENSIFLSSNGSGQNLMQALMNTQGPQPTTEKKLRRSSVDSALRDFQQSFKSLVSTDENLISHYGCAYLGSVLKHGRLYLTENFICFYDNIVFDKSKQRQKVVPISSITGIEKRSGLAPNGILIKTQERDYQFCLFIHRDEAFEVIEALMLNQEQHLMSQSIAQKNIVGLRQVLSQRRTRSSSGKTSKRSKSVDGTVILGSKIPNTNRDHPVITIIKQNDLEMLNILLEHYTQNKVDDINHADKEGYTPLHVAVSSDISDNITIQILKHPTTNVHVKNVDGNTPLHYFCQKYRSPECQKIVQMFIEKGANVNEQNNNGETPLHKAIFNHGVRMLMVYVLLKNNANINIVNHAGESALHYAVRLGRLDVLKTLITAGADPTLVSTKQKKSPLMLAEEESNCTEIIDLLIRLEFIINTLTVSGLTQFKMALVLEEISQEGTLSRMDDEMITRIGCVDPDQKRLLFSLKHKKILVGKTPHITAGAMNLLKELENMDIKNGKWVISQHELEYTDKIGTGISGKVYKGLYRGREVAIKVLKSADEANSREEFLKEFHVLASLHSNLIVGLYGVVLEPRICLVMEYCQQGSLYQVLHNEKMTWERFFSFAGQLLNGISTLHQSEPQILHRDVKSLNFLVTRDSRIKVADFGLSRFNTKSNIITLNKTRGTSAYCAPEVFQGREYKDKSDIYSLAIVFWELIFTMFNGRYLHPYGEYKKMNEFQIMLYACNNNLRPTIPTVCPNSIKTMISKCWDASPEERPTALEAIELLALAEKDYQQDTALWAELLSGQPMDCCSESSSLSDEPILLSPPR
ncbi:hypothetical protein SAMD00019534_122370 [Acytostelium subglobosum LB1]|uniref:hypothetical protein n=1 Tax=Acytostelium subglobosum LB1 TaxID=1410327 RepID=UPI000644DB5A|nr:hypothetical protein SAMD00019534_122370 [Acytostelium subglobosum LB1]GAM29061.1 hypothetical protein SAMD00019534_122370 [Acytostelium subglobosum LB1]|eukprot:XP_012748067.1 hypothetical protein SAMD00019534_122370 [Acytostelium subglobosum LB1]